MPKDGLDEPPRPAVMQQPTMAIHREDLTDPPERGRSPFPVPEAPIDPPVGERGSKIMQEQVRVRTDHPDG